MSRVEHLREVLLESALLPVTEKKNSIEVELRDATALESRVTIKGLPKASIILKVDESFPAPTDLLSDSKGQNRRADFAIFSENDSRARIIFLEMKTSNCKASDAKKQLKGAICVMDYIDSISKNFWESSGVLEGVAKHFVILCNTGAPRKRKTGRIDPTPNTTPESARKISRTNAIYYNSLI